MTHVTAGPAEDRPSPTRPTSATVAGVLAALLHVGIAVFPLSASGLLAPGWAIVVIYLGWMAAAGMLWRIWQHRPALGLLVAPTTLAIWAGFMTVGDVLLGWTA